MIEVREGAMREQRGFTLIELMVVVAIIAIIAAFAMPSYLRYGFRARRVDGQELLLRVANAQERYYATHNQYGSLDQLGYTTVASRLSEKGFYRLDIELLADTGPAMGFTATAVVVPGGLQRKDDCKNLEIDDAGRKTQTGQTSNGTCG